MRQTHLGIQMTTTPMVSMIMLAVMATILLLLLLLLLLPKLKLFQTPLGLTATVRINATRLLMLSTKVTLLDQTAKKPSTIRMVAMMMIKMQTR